METNLITSTEQTSAELLLESIGTNDTALEVSEVLSTTRQPVDLTNLSNNLYAFTQPDVVTHYLHVTNNDAVEEQIREALKEIGGLLYQSFVERLARGDSPSREAVIEIVCIKRESTSADVQEENRHVFLLQMKSDFDVPNSKFDFSLKNEDEGIAGNSYDSANTVFEQSTCNNSSGNESQKHNVPANQYSHKSKLSYTDMITQAILSSPRGQMSVHEIYQWISDNFPHIRDKTNKRWQGVVRTTLCQTNKFARVGTVKSGHGGYYWSLQPRIRNVAERNEDQDNIDTDEETFADAGRIDEQPIEQDDTIDLDYHPSLSNFSFQTVNMTSNNHSNGQIQTNADSSKDEKNFTLEDNISPTVADASMLFLCDICGKSCVDSNSLKAHQRIHALPKSYSCRYCTDVCYDSRSLKVHVRETHSEMLQHVCETCKKSFARYADLARHLMTHSGERPFACTECDKTFTQAGGLKRHMDTHMKGQQQQSCPVCGRRLASPYCLQRHMRNHCENSKVSCDICGRKFAFVSVMERHRRGHTGERPYICHLCGKNFRDSGTLVIHMRTHSGERPYVCQYCDKRFRHKTNLNDHIKIHTGQENHKCDECAVQFSRFVTLMRHKRSCHGKERPLKSEST